MWSADAPLALSGLAASQPRGDPAENLENPRTVPETAHRRPAILGSIRTIIVPPDIVAVPRQSPIPIRKRTPWHPKPDADGITERGGSREWFSDRLFVESRQVKLREACSTSALVHLGCAAAIGLTLLAGTVPAPPVPVMVSLRMPSMLAMVPNPVPPPAGRRVEPPAPKPPAAPLSAPPVVVAMPAAVEPEPLVPTTEPAPSDEPVAAPSDEPGAPGGIEGGVGDGAGIVGGGIAGSGIAAVAAPATGPVRLGEGIERPRKIKDVKPVYPAYALALDTRGTVIVDLVVGVDGRVIDATIRQSVPALDQAALKAVRQWEFTPARRNGEPIAVIVTAIVSFAIL